MGAVIQQLKTNITQRIQHLKEGNQQTATIHLHNYRIQFLMKFMLQRQTLILSGI